ncbi:MAG: hypothetical protein AAGJ38_06935 [Planctomycetota bacterium]
MNRSLPEQALTLVRMASCSLLMVIFIAAIPGCQYQPIIVETPTEFTIKEAQIIDSPNRYGGSASDETLQLLEQRIRDYGLSDDDVWFIYLRVSSKYEVEGYYAEIYKLPEQIDGRLYGGEFVVLRTEAIDKEMAELMARFEEPIPSPVHPYIWIKPNTPATLPGSSDSIGLNTLPIQPLTDFPRDRLVALVDLIRTAPQVPDTIQVIENGDSSFDLVTPGEKVKPNRPIWQIEGTPDEPIIYLLDSDRRRKRGQLVTVVWIGDRYEVEGIGLYGTQTNFLWQY